MEQDEQLRNLPADASTERSTTEAGKVTTFPLLLAVGPGPISAIARVTAALARECRARPTVTYSVEVGMYAVSGEFGEMAVAVEAIRGKEFWSNEADRIRSRLLAETADAAAWPVEIELGDAGSAIARQARRINAELIVMGLRHVGRLEHLVEESIGYRVMKANVAPVLAVHPTLDRRPLNMMVALDFSEASIRAARLAARLIHPDGTLHLVYVQPSNFDDAADSIQGPRAIHEHGVRASFAQIQQELQTPRLHIEHVTLTGDPKDALAQFAEQLDPECIAIGSQRHSIIQRLFVGSVTHALVRDARRSMLVVPPLLN